MIRRNLINIVLLNIVCLTVVCQTDSSKFVKYSSEYKFTDGVFFLFDQVVKNKPLPKTRIITSVNYENPLFFDLVLKERKINYYDNIGQQKTVATNSIWGYAKNGTLYVKVNSLYARITLVGTIGHFVASQTNYDSRYPSSSYGNYYYDPYSSVNTYPTTELKQYLIDFTTGELYDYTSETLSILLMKDPELYDEYNSLSRKKKRQQKFIYLRKFNERNPLYLFK